MKKNIIKLHLIALLFLASNWAKAQCPGPALTLSTTTTATSCPTNGSITATIGGGVAPYLYSITAGPSTLPYQSSNILSGLDDGTYTIQALDACNNTITATAIVADGYNEMVLSRTWEDPTCNSPGNGSTTLTVAGGTAPFSYTLLSGTTVVAGPQTNNVFTGLSSGSYTAEVTDACGEIRTIGLSLTNNDIKFHASINTSDQYLLNSTTAIGVIAAPEPYASNGLHYLDSYAGPISVNCDTVATRFAAFVLPTSSISDVMRRIFVKDLVTGDTVFDDTFDRSAANPNRASSTAFLQKNRNYRIYYSDLCDDLDSTDRNYNTKSTYTIHPTVKRTCDEFCLEVRWDNHPALKTYSAPEDTITLIGSSLPGDTAINPLAYQQIIHKVVNVNDSLGWSLQGGIKQRNSFCGITPGESYTIEVRSLCGIDTLTFSTNTLPQPSISHSVRNSACIEGTADFRFSLSNWANNDGYRHIVVNSGPNSFTDSNNNVVPISYPYHDSVYSNSNNINLGSLPVGTYDIDFYDACGYIVNYSLIVTPAHVMQAEYDPVIIDQRCNGSSSVTVNVSNYQNYYPRLQLFRKTGSTYSLVDAVLIASLPTHTFNNLIDGEYRVIARPNSSGSNDKIVQHQCDTIYQEDFTLQYELPNIDTSSYGYVCSGGNSGFVQLYTSGGSKPFTFEQLAIPGNTVLTTQSDSLFTGLARGTHRFRITDSCLNSTVYDITIDTLLSPSVQLSNPAGCIGTPVQLYAGSNFPEDMIFTWSGPGSFTSTGDAISFNPLMNSDTGTYVLTATHPNCPNSSYTEQALINSTCTPLPLLSLEFNAQQARYNPQNVLLNWQFESALHIDYFVIEHSINAVDFNDLGVVDYSTLSNTYDYLHTDVPYSNNYYRLRIVDTDGTATYSAVRKVSITNPINNVTIWPNPADKSITISELEENQIVSIITIDGRVLNTIKAVSDIMEIDISHLAKSIYIVKISDSNGHSINIKIRKD